MEYKKFLSVVGWLTIFLLGTMAVSACDCAGGANPCSFFRGKDGVAFIGTVTNVIETNEKYGQPVKGKVRKITIRVDELFKGNLPDEIITSDDGFQCDNYPFSLGGKYLIYAKGVLENTENIVPVGLCSGTAPVEMAQDAINFLRQLKEGKTISVLYGKAQRSLNVEKNPYAPLSETKIILTRKLIAENGQYRPTSEKDQRLEVLTDENGEYKFENLAPGRYQLSVKLPSGLWMMEGREFFTGGQPSCDYYPVYAFPDGRISGNVVSADGVPVGFLKLNISPLDGTTRYFYSEAQTDKDGHYTFYGLSEGRYKISVSLHGYSTDGNRTHLFNTNYPYWAWYFPNTFEEKQAEVINLGSTQKIQNINLKMPPLPVERIINGIVIREDGKPADKTIVSYRIKKLGNNYQRYISPKEDGTFSFPVYKGFEYEFLAENNSNENRAFSDWTTFTDEELKSQIKLVLKPRK